MLRDVCCYTAKCYLSAVFFCFLPVSRVARYARLENRNSSPRRYFLFEPCCFFFVLLVCPSGGPLVTEIVNWTCALKLDGPVKNWTSVSLLASLQVN